MQLRFKFPAFGLILSLLAFSACHNDDNSNGTTGSTPPPGAWKVTYFFDKQDETGNYAGYVFDFESNGALTATQGGSSWSGTWTTGVDDSHDKMVLDFAPGAPSALTELEEDWLILEMTDNLMRLEHTSGGNGDTDVVKFERN